MQPNCLTKARLKWLWSVKPQRLAMALMGMSLASKGEEAVYAERLEALAEGLPTTIFCRNAGPFRGRLLQQ